MSGISRMYHILGILTLLKNILKKHNPFYVFLFSLISAIDCLSYFLWLQQSITFQMHLNSVLT